MGFDSLLLATGASGGAQPGGVAGMIGTMGPMILIFVIMYLLLIRPQQKKAKEHRELVGRIKAGDQIVTNGGIRGVVTGVKDEFVVLRIAEKVEIELLRSAIGTVITPRDTK